MQASLFNQEPHLPTNILPHSGEVILIPGFLSHDAAQQHFRNLQSEVNWQSDEVRVFNHHIVTRRQNAWYGDHPYSYTYSGIQRRALPWPAGVMQLKQLVEQACGDSFNSCLLNFYHDGDDGMGWHSDNEPELLHHGTIASLSLGATRRFLFKHKTSGEKAEVLLETGSLLLMKGAVQEHWLHSLPKTTRVRTPRINLTFRTIINATTR